jgi:hypothetical protein
MSNPSKDKGDRFERDVVAALTAMGVHAYRTLSAGIPRDAGDVHAGKSWTLSVKDRTQWTNMADWVNAVLPMVAWSGRRNGALIMKRARRPIEDSYVIMSLADLAAIIRAAEA